MTSLYNLYYNRIHCDPKDIEHDPKTEIKSCNKCDRKWKMEYKNYYSCSTCKKYDVETRHVYKLCKDGSCNWTKCDTCGKILKFTQKKVRIDLSNY